MLGKGGKSKDEGCQERSFGARNPTRSRGRILSILRLSNNIVMHVTWPQSDIVGVYWMYMRPINTWMLDRGYVSNR
jgi:hypothetical protein